MTASRDTLVAILAQHLASYRDCHVGRCGRLHFRPWWDFHRWM